MPRGVANDPAEQVARGLEQLRALVEAGSQLCEPRMTTHGFHGDADALEGLRYALRQSGYTVDAVEDGELSAQSYGVIDEPWLREAMVILCRVADHFGVSYDGWTAGTDPQPVN